MAVPNAAWASACADWKGAASPWSAGSDSGKIQRATRAPRAATPTSSWPRVPAVVPSIRTDFTSLRFSWLGFGDWLLRSDAFLELMAYARDHETTVPEAVAQLRTQRRRSLLDDIPGSSDGPLDELDELLRACEAG